MQTLVDLHRGDGLQSGLRARCIGEKEVRFWKAILCAGEEVLRVRSQVWKVRRHRANDE
jgi:hypothetical protein